MNKKDFIWILGALGFIGGIALGLYVGVWLMFIGGIIGIIEAIVLIFSSGVVNADLIGWSIVKIIFASFVGYISAIAIIFPSLHLMKKGL